MASKILKHLKTRKIAPIVEMCDEKNNLSALKLMSVIDHKLEKYAMYEEIIRALPKLLKQLLGIKKFSNLHFWRYRAPNKFDKKYVLMCKVCNLIGPYHLIQIHMASTHEAHFGAKVCMYCNKHDIKRHIAENSLQTCYEQYLAKEDITDTKFPSIIVTFYDMLEELCDRLEISSVRNESYIAAGNKRKRSSFEADPTGDIHGTYIEFDKGRHRSTINEQQLNKFFKTVITDFYGSTRINEFMPELANEMKKTPINIDADEAESHESTIPVPGTSLNRTAKSTVGQLGSFLECCVENISDKKLKNEAKLALKTVALDYARKSIENERNQDEEHAE